MGTLQHFHHNHHFAGVSTVCMILEWLACVAHTKIRVFTEEQPVRYEGRFNLVAYVAIYIISLACSLSLITN